MPVWPWPGTGKSSNDELVNGSRVYIRGLKTQDQTNRYSKFRGLTLSRVYIDQAEEIPKDVYGRPGAGGPLGWMA